MARRRRGRNYVKKSGVYATPGGFDFPSGAGQTRASVLAAAEIVATAAKVRAAKFSKRIPAATYVEPNGEQGATVVTDGHAAPNAAPFEFGERHPLWGRWVTGKGKQPMRAYMSNAARSKTVQAAAAEVYGDLETQLLAKEHGYTE